MAQLPRTFFSSDAPDVALRLLGKVLVMGECSGRITEVEAYTRDDPASHSFRGPTTRNAAMFGEPGHLYVYFVYGMHYCANVVTGMAGDGQAVLIRSAIPINGQALMIERRGRRTRLADGPAKLCQSFAIDLALDGADLCVQPSIGIFDDGYLSEASPEATSRVGIRVATDRLWRWSIAS